MVATRWGRGRRWRPGQRALGVGKGWRLPPRERLGLGRLEAALTRLDGATPPVKVTVLEACVVTALADGQVTVEEAELVRATAAALGLPMPRLGRGESSAA